MGRRQSVYYGSGAVVAGGSQVGGNFWAAVQRWTAALSLYNRLRVGTTPPLPAQYLGPRPYRRDDRDVLRHAPPHQSPLGNALVDLRLVRQRLGDGHHHSLLAGA